MRYVEIAKTTMGSLILESPQEVLDTDFDLHNKPRNRAFAARLMKRVAEVIEDNPKYQIVRTGSQDNGWILLYNKAEETADYVVQYRKRRWRLFPTTVTQCVLWRDVGSPYVRGLAVRIFFDYLLQHNPAIMSDSLQTKAGNDFWIARMIDAVARHKKVAVANLYHRQLNWFDASGKQPLRDWLDAQHTYGSDAKLQGIRYIIAN